MKKGVTRPLALLTLPLLLLACGQNPAAEPPTAGETDPYAGADYPWSYTAPGGRVEALALTAGWNTLQYETPTSMSNGWGPVEKNRSNGEQAAGDGKPLTLNGVVYAQGFGTHAQSGLSFDLQGTYGARCTRFAADIGVDDEVGTRGSVVFRVLLDGTEAYNSGIMTGASATRKIDLDISGKRELRLEVGDAGNGKSYDHADWANPRVLCAAGTGGTPGTADPGFRRIVPGFQPGDAEVQPDGKIVMFGIGNPTGTGVQYIVARYGVGGAPDTGFGQGGQTALFVAPRVTAIKVLVQADGKILALGRSTFTAPVGGEQRQLTLLRFLPGGLPDASFGTGGVVLTGEALNPEGTPDFDVQDDGKVVVMEGVARENGFRVVRFQASGAPDPTFGQAGQVTVPFDLPPGALSATVAATAVEVQPDGKIVAAGVQHVSEQGANYGQQVFARLLPGGGLDPSFGGSGQAVGQRERFLGQTVDDLLIQPDGKILASTEGSYEYCALDRLNANGSYDDTFNRFGIVGRRVAPIKLALQADGKVLVAGCAQDNMVGEVVKGFLTRVLPGGQRDTSFGDAAAPVVVEDTREVLLQPDGKIVVGLNPAVRLFP